MSYPMQCAAGFPMPLHVGKFEIVGISATADVTSGLAQLVLYDDRTIGPNDLFGKLVPPDNMYTTRDMIIDMKHIAALDDHLSYSFEEPIKTRHGLSVSAINIKGGSICVYRR